jgi:hypothetical protein
MPPKKITTPGAALQPVDTNQETLSLFERPEAKRERPPVQHFRRRRWTRKSGTWRSFTSRCKGKKEKMAWLADLHRKIDEATEEVCHLTQDDHDRRPQHRELHQEDSFNEDEWYDDFNHGTFTFDDASPLAAELQAIPWPQSYKPPQLPMYDGHLDPKAILDEL